jgi:sugar phosphate isomerase/epimerase
MKYAICNEVYRDWSFARALEHAKQLGYTGIEIAPFTLGPNAAEISFQQRRLVRQMAADNGLAIVGLHWLLARTQGYHLTHPDPRVRIHTAAYLIELTRLCADLGGNILVFGSPQQRSLENGVSHQEGSRFAVEVLSSVAPVLEDTGVTLALEPLGPDEGNFILTAQSAIDLIRKIDSPNVRLNLDVKAMATENRPIPETIRDSKEWLVHFHANDPNRRGPGMGEVDFKPIVQALYEIHYTGWVSVEVFDYQPGIESLTAESIRYLKTVERTVREWLDGTNQSDKSDTSDPRRSDT